MAGRHLGPVRQRKKGRTADTPSAGAEAHARVDTPTGAGHVDATVAAEVARQLRAPRLTGYDTVAEQYQQLGRTRFTKIATETQNGHPPAQSTINTWRRENRIPNEQLALRMSREAEIEMMGGTAYVADTLGVTTRTVRRYATGVTDNFRAPAVRHRYDLLQRAVAAGVDHQAQPTIRITGEFSIVGPNMDYPIGFRDITMSPSNTYLSPQFIERLFDAWTRHDEAELAVLIESALTVDYFGANYLEFSTYSEANRVRIDRIDTIDIRWVRRHRRRLPTR